MADAAIADACRAAADEDEALWKGSNVSFAFVYVISFHYLFNYMG